MTASGNSILNRALMMAWVLMTVGDVDYKEFISIISTLVMGDDHVVRVRKDYQDVLNGNSLRTWFLDHGIDYTPANKNDENNFKFMYVDEIEFVKMNNRILANGTIVAVPMIISANSGLQYLAAPRSTHEILLSNLCDGFSFSLFWHGEDLYNRYRDALITIAENNGIALQMATYEERYGHFIRLFNRLPGYEPKSMSPVLSVPTGKSGGLYIDSLYDLNSMSCSRTHGLTKAYIEGPFDFQSGNLEKVEEVKELMADFTEAAEALPVQGDTPVMDQKTQTQAPTAEFDVDDSAWSFSNLAEKRFFYNTVDYSVSAVAGQLLAYWPVPLGMVGNCQQRIPFTRFKYWRGNAGMRVIINKNPFQSGMLCLWWAPMVEPGLTVGGTLIPGDNITRMTGMRHVLIDIQSTSSAVEFEVPFSYLLSALPLDENAGQVTGSCMGTIGLSVVAPLRAGVNTATSLAVNVHTYFPNSVFMVPLFDDTCKQENAIYNPVPSNGDMPGHFVSQGGKVSKSTEITNIIIGSENDTSQDPGGDVYEQGQRLAASYQVGGADFDRALTNIHPVPVELNTNASQNKVVQPIAADPFGPTLKEQPICREHVFGTTVDEMSFETLLSTWQYTGRTEWSTSLTAGQSFIINPISICPMFAGRFLGVENKVPATYMDFLSTMHAYWHGPIEYKIVVIASGMVSGSLIFTPRYGFYEETGFDLQTSTTQYYSVLSLDSSSRSMEIELTNPTIYPYFKTSGKRYTDMSFEERKENVPGTYAISVQNPLVVGAGAPSIADVLIFVRAPKVKFFQRKRASAIPDFNVIPSTPVLRKQSMTLKALTAKRKKEQEKNNRATLSEKFKEKFPPAPEQYIDGDYESQSSRAYNPNMAPPENSSTAAGRVTSTKVTLGAKPKSLRYNNLQQFSSLRTHIKQFYGHLETNEPNGEFYVEEMFFASFLGQFASIYSMWRGVSLVKVVSQNPDDVIRLTFTPHDVTIPDNFDIYGDCCYKGLVFAGAPARVFAIPFLTQYKYLLTPQSSFNTSDSDFATPGTLYFTSELGETVYPFFSLGDEFRFGGLIGVPTMTMDPNDL